MKTGSPHERKPLTRLLAFICTLAMLLSVAAVLPITVGAATDYYSIKSQEDFQNAVQKAKTRKSNHAYFRFDSDVNIVLDENLPASNSGQEYLFFFEDMDFTFDLNGKTVTIKNTPNCPYTSTFHLFSTNSGCPFFIISDSNLTIKDSSAVNGQSGTGIMKFVADERAQYGYVSFICFRTNLFDTFQSFTIESGTLDGADCNYLNCCIMLRNPTSATIQNGTIQNFHGNNGGVVYSSVFATQAAFTMTGGTIKNCSSSQNGGAIHFGGDISITNATIQDCSAGGSGGAIWATKDVKLENATIKDCTAGKNGGAICIADAKLTAPVYDSLSPQSKISGTTVIQNCRAGKSGGAIAIEAIDRVAGFELAGGTISNCTATVNGAGIYNADNLTLSGGTITDCEATGDNSDTTRGRGGALYCATGSVTTLSGTTLDYNKAVNGGGIFMWGGTLNMTGGSIDSNQATQNGSALCMFHTDKEADVVFNMTGGSITSYTGPSGIYAGSDKDQINISGTATVDVGGQNYGIVNGSGDNISISASASVRARGLGTNGKAFMHTPKVNGNAAVWTRNIADFDDLSEYTLVSNPTEADYYKPITWITYAGQSTVRFYDNGTLLFQKTQPAGTILELPSDVLSLSRDGYTFVKWTPEGRVDNLTLSVTFTGQNTDFTSVWDYLPLYTLDYVQGGEAPSDHILIKEENITKPFTLPESPDLPGYTFQGWYLGNIKLGNDGETVDLTKQLKSGIDSVITGKTIVITARYSQVKYKLTFDQGNGSPKVYELAGGTNIANALASVGGIPSITATRNGYVATGWSNLPDTMPYRDLTITPRWVPEENFHTLTVNPNNGGRTYTVRVESGKPIPYPSLINPGKKLASWEQKKTGSDSDYYYGSTMPDHDLTITARWTVSRHSITVKYADDGKTSDASLYQVGYGNDLTSTLGTRLTPPAREGYVFDHWDGWPEDGKMPDYDLVLTAVWERAKHTMTVNPNNGEDTYTVEVTYGDPIPYPKLTYKGHSIFVWITSSADGIYQGSTVPDSDLTIQAIWIACSYAITIDYNDDKTFPHYQGVYYDYDLKETLGDKLTPPTRDGYTFGGWQNWPESGKMPDHDLTLTAIWLDDCYHALTIKPENGEKDTIQYIEEGKDIPLPDDPTRDGYTFIGWSGLPADGKMPTSDLVLTALWAQNHTLTIRYDNGEADSVYTVAEGAALSLPTGITKIGHAFDGWDGVPADNKMPASDLTITAKWTKNSYKLTLKPENGEQNIVSTVEYGAALSLPTDITKAGHRFTGWDGVPDGNTMPAHDVIITATWSINAYTLTIKLDNGQQDIVSTVEYGADLNLPTDLTKTGHAFAGWEGATADNKMPANDLTVTAKWTKNSYTLTIKLDNGQADIVRTVAYGADLNLPTDPTKTGHAFNGWEGATADNKMPAQDLTVTATWRKIGFESVTIDPTADLTLHLTAYLPEGNAAATLRVTLDGKTVELQPTAGATLDVYNFTYTGVTPYVLSHSLTLELVLGEQVIDSRTTSAAEICVEVAQAQPELKQTVADLMAFCAATADYLGYDDTTAAAIRSLMAANGLAASDREVNLTDSKRIGARPTGDTRLLGVGLYFENTTGMYIRFKTSNVSRVTLIVGQTTYTAEDFAQKDWTEFVLYLPGVSLDDLTEVNHVSLCVNGQEIQSMDYAISDYIAVTHKGTGTYSAGIRALTKALYNWKESAEAV